MPGFADDQEYRYYGAVARFGEKLPEPVAFKMVYDAFTEPMLYRMYCDDEPAPPGIGRFDLSPIFLSVASRPTAQRTEGAEQGTAAGRLADGTAEHGGDRLGSCNCWPSGRRCGTVANRRSLRRRE